MISTIIRKIINSQIIVSTTMSKGSQNWAKVPRDEKGRYVSWSKKDYNEIYSSTDIDVDSSKTLSAPTPREELTEYVKEKHTAESNINEELVAKTIDFVGSDMERKEEIAATIADNFTKEEINKMTERGDLQVIHGEKVVRKATADAAHGDRTEDNIAIIQIDNDADKAAITHEFVHHLRTEDGERTGLSKTAYALDEKGYVVGDSKSVRNIFAEECAVIAETEIRTKFPTTRPNANLGKLDRQQVEGNEIIKSS